MLTVLQELGETIDQAKLLESVKADGNLAYGQRLGWLLEKAGYPEVGKRSCGMGWGAKPAAGQAGPLVAYSRRRKKMPGGNSLSIRKWKGTYDSEGPYCCLAQLAPWVSDAQVEQDLIMSRALVAIFQDPFLSKVWLSGRDGIA